MKHLLLGLILGAIVVLLLWFLVLKDRQGAVVHQGVVTTFGECVKGGFQVVNDVPRKCVTPDGREFIEEKEKKPVGI